MSYVKRPVAIAIIAALFLTMVTLLASTQPAAAQDACVAEDTIAGVASASDDFNILVAALGVADLVGAVADVDAELTVFAPTDAAFIATATALGYDGDTTDEAAVATWLVETLGDQLTPVLTYHVAAGALLAADVAAGPVTTLEGTTVSVDDLDIATADLVVCNGVIHVINNVLIPAQTAAALAPAPTAVPAPTLAPVVIQPAPAPAPVIIQPAPTPVIIAAAPIIAEAPAEKKAESATTKLAHTGSTSSTMVLAGALLLILGGILVLTQRRFQRKES